MWKFLLKKHNGNGSFLGVKALNKWHAGILQTRLERGTGYTTQREVTYIHRQREVIHTHTEKGS